MGFFMSSDLRPWPPFAVIGLTIGALAFSALAWAAPAAADPAPPFAELLRQAQATAPRLAQSGAELRRAEGLARQAAVRPNPTAGLEVENFAGSGPFSGVDGAQTTLSVAQPFELGGKRSARVSAGQADVVAARARQTQAGADFAYDLADAYGKAEAADRRLVLAQEAVALSEEDARAANALVEAGKEADLRAIQVRAAVSAARAEVDQRRAERETAFARLTALSGSPVPLTSIASELLTRPAAASPIAPADVLRTPGYLAAQAEREAAARRIKLEQARAAPDLTVSVGVRRLGYERATALVAGVSAPLPLFDLNRGAVSAARAELEAAEARLNAARLDAEASARASAVQIGAAESRVAAAVETEQAAGEVYRLTRVGYDGGKLSLLELQTARRALTEARSRTVDAELDRLAAEAALARLQGRTPFGGQP